MDMSSDVAAFYRAPNEVDLAALSDESAGLVRTLVARLAAGKRTLLPAMAAGMTRWYGLAPDSREGRLLTEEVQAWLGPPVGSCAIRVGPGGDALDEAACLATPDGVCLRIDVESTWRSEARSNVRSMLDVWQSAPERGMDVPRPVGRVLRDFFAALGARDRATAQAAIDEIRTRSLLSATNVKFLRVHLIGTLGSPLEMRDDPDLKDIAKFRRPPAVTGHLARAADALFIAPRLSGDAAPMVDWAKVAGVVEDEWPGLVSHPSQVDSMAAARCLALSESLAAEPRHAVCQALEAEWNADPVVTAVLARLRGVPSTPAQATIAVLYQRGDFEAALDLAAGASLNDKDAVSVLHAAFSLGDAQSATRAVALVDGMDDEARHLLLDGAVERNLYQQLVDTNAGRHVPRGWHDWLIGDWPDRPDVLREWATGWDRVSVLNDGGADDVVLALMDALAGEQRGRTRNGLPILIEWLCEPDGLLPGAVGPAVTVLGVMLEGDGGRSERRAGLRLAEEILRAGCSASEFAELAAALRGVLSGLGSREADWLIEALDVLLFSSVPDEHPRHILLAAAHSAAVQWVDRLTGTQAILLTKLFTAAGLDFPVPPPDPDNGESRRRRHPFRRVGIYSLAESAARRAQQWIEEQWPGTDVTLAREHVNSDRLEAMARNCDVVVVQTSHAKHAAVAALEAAATPGGTLLRVHGRGATSLVRALLERVAEAA